MKFSKGRKAEGRNQMSEGTPLFETSRPGHGPLGTSGIESVQGPQDSVTTRDVHEPTNINNMPTIHDVASKIQRRDRKRGSRVRKSDPVITLGLKPIPFKNEIGYRIIPPEELASLRIPRARLTANKIEGYQRAISIPHVFELAWAWEDGKEMPNLQISLDEFGNAYATDGQHRALAAIVRRQPLEAIVKQRTFQQQKNMFEGQTFAKKLSKDHMVLTGNDAMALYVQDALTNSRNPWYDMVSEKKNPHRISPAAMHRLVTMFGCNEAGAVTAQRAELVQRKFDPNAADYMAELIRVFGEGSDGSFDKASNPVPYTAKNLNVMGQACLQIFIRASEYTEVHPGPDKERWRRHMTGFNWTSLQPLEQKQATQALLDFWNKKMTSRKIHYNVGK
jgi:hypothetical protein